VDPYTNYVIQYHYTEVTKTQNNTIHVTRQQNIQQTLLSSKDNRIQQTIAMHHHETL